MCVQTRWSVLTLLLTVASTMAYMCTALAHGKGSPPADELERFMQDAGFRQAAIDAALDWGITLADLQGISVGELGDSCKATGRESKRAELKMLNAK